MNNLERMAQLFSERNNPTSINVTVGEVVGVEPYRIKWGQRIIIEQTDMVIASSIMENTNTLKTGDKVIMIPDNDFKRWYIIDKVGYYVATS